jgi:heat shock protein HtpX
MYRDITSNKRKTVLLFVFFFIFVIAIGYLVSYLLDFGAGGLVLAFLIALVMALVSYYSGDKIALASSGAQAIEKEANPHIYRLVENLCITAGTPTPKIYLIPDPALNAFATGRDPEHASIALTTGLVEKLQNEELEGVIAHELSHIRNYDIRLMTVVVVLVGTLAILSNFFVRGSLFRGRSRSDNNNAGGIMMIVGLILIVLSPIIAQIIQLAISRKREYLADASGALLTRYPEGLARALEKISAVEQPLAKASSATAHLFIASPFGKDKFFSRIFSTHPPVNERIRRLREMGI